MPDIPHTIFGAILWPLLGLRRRNIHSRQARRKRRRLLFQLSTREACILHSVQRDYVVRPPQRTSQSWPGKPRHGNSWNHQRDWCSLLSVACRLGFPSLSHGKVWRCPRWTMTIQKHPRANCNAAIANCGQWEEVNLVACGCCWWEGGPPPAWEAEVEVEFRSYDKVLQALTFEDDHELVKQAIYLVDTTVEHS